MLLTGVFECIQNVGHPRHGRAELVTERLCGPRIWHHEPNQHAAVPPSCYELLHLLYAVYDCVGYTESRRSCNVRRFLARLGIDNIGGGCTHLHYIVHLANRCAIKPYICGDHPSEQLGIVVGLDCIVGCDGGQMRAPEGELPEKPVLVEQEDGRGRQR